MLTPSAQHEAWRALAIQTQGLNAVERGVLSCIAEHFRQLAARGYGPGLSYDRLGHHLDVDPVRVKWAVSLLREFGLIGIKPASGQRPNEYLLALPRRLATSLSTAADDELPPFLTR